MSMAAGEYVSVGSQKDTEEADLGRERAELEASPETEHAELTAIYFDRGVEAETASRVAEPLMAHDALAAHARDGLGISDMSKARPLQAAVASAGTFACGAAIPLGVAIFVPITNVIPVEAGTSLASLIVLGALAAGAGGANVIVGALRVGVWGALAMGLTTAVGRLFGAVV